MTNRLSDALSPYLRQHADNPVDWWPWGESAFDEARRRDVPIFLSVGYAACHWCHVMAHESFSDPATAALLNTGFVSIKVDREEHPDVDAAYMRATTALTGRGGWPMSVWLDHQGRAFYAGTYFPPTPRMGMPSFAGVLEAVSRAWTERRAEVDNAAVSISEALARTARPRIRKGDAEQMELTDLRRDTTTAVAALRGDFDAAAGGFGGAPKFPPTMVAEFLLRHHAATGDDSALEMAAATLTAMARGGIYDQLAGGFARYSVDDGWVVPHFEKMLYDNAGLLTAYTTWWRVTGDALARRVAEEVAAFVVGDLRTPEGGFASSLDADSLPTPDAESPVEGAYYVWRRDELVAELGEQDALWWAELCDVTAAGTFGDGASTLQLPQDPDDAERFVRVRARLLAARHDRPAPARDDKVVAGWNGMMIAALAEAAMVFDAPDWLSAAVDAAVLITEVHVQADGSLRRVSRDGEVGAAAAVLEDYAELGLGYLTLYQATSELLWFERAQRLLTTMVERFSDPDGGLYDAEPSVLLPAATDPTDNASPSGTSAAAAALLTLAALGGSATADNAATRELVVGLVGSAQPLMATHPRFAGMWLATAEALLAGPAEVAIVGAGPSADARGQEELALLVGTAWRTPAPGRVIAVTQSPVDSPALLAHRGPVAGRPAAYVCRGFVCQAPTVDPAELREALNRR